MKTTWSSKVRTLVLAASLTGSVGFLSPAYGEVFPASYLIDLNTKEWTRLETLGIPLTRRPSMIPAEWPAGSAD
jgi:hypothetical protein